MFVATEKLPGLAKALSKTKATLMTIVFWGPGNPAALQVRAWVQTNNQPLKITVYIHGSTVLFNILQ